MAPTVLPGCSAIRQPTPSTASFGVAASRSAPRGGARARACRDGSVLGGRRDDRRPRSRRTARCRSLASARTACSPRPTAPAGIAAARRRWYGHGPGDRRAGRRQRDRRRRREHRRQVGVRAHPVDAHGRARRRVRAARRGDDADGHPGRQRLHHRHGALGQPALGGGTPGRHAEHAQHHDRPLLRHRRAAAAPAAAGHLDARRGRDHRDERPCDGQGQHPWQRRDLLPRVRHLHQLRQRRVRGEPRRVDERHRHRRHDLGSVAEHAVPRALRDLERHRHRSGRRPHVHDGRQRRPRPAGPRPRRAPRRSARCPR